MPLEPPKPTVTIRGLEEYADVRRLLSPDDLVLSLACASPIMGNTRLQKQSFLLQKEYPDITTDPGFHPDRFGPYSKAVSDSVKILKSRGFLVERPGRKYCITEHGENHIKSKLESLGVKPEEIAEQKRRWDEWLTPGIITYVYRLYPEYTVATEVPHLKW